MDYSSVLAELRAKREALDRERNDLTAAIERLQRLAVASAPDAHHARGTEFAGLSMPAALQKHLSTLRTPQPKDRIKAALLAGGMPRTKDFGAKVYNALYRLKGDGGPFFQDKQGRWGLRAWQGNGAPRRRTRKA